MRALIVGAHPDDAELYAGATIASWAAAGAHVEILVLTDGRLGSSDPRRDPEDVARVRAAEAKAGAEAIGAAGLRMGPWRDGELSEAGREPALLVARTIREVRPDVLVGHDAWRPYELHPDHRAAGLATTDGMIAAREVHGLPGETAAAHRPAELWLMGTGAPDHVVEAAAQDFERKIAALAAHESQFSHVAGWQERVRRWNARIGAERGMGLAEAFHRILPAGDGS